MSEIAIILIRGRIGAHHSVKHTLDLLNLYKKHNCVIVKDSPEYKGMIQKVKDFITWGTITTETKELLEKKGMKGKSFCLNPPRGGFERKGIKQPYSLGGVLGNRKEAINGLIQKMV